MTGAVIIVEEEGRSKEKTAVGGAGGIHGPQGQL